VQVKRKVFLNYFIVCWVKENVYLIYLNRSLNFILLDIELSSTWVNKKVQFHMKQM